MRSRQSFLILQADVLRGLTSLQDESVDCVVTSPPYWKQRDYQVNGQIGRERTYQEYVKRIVEVFGELRRVLKPTGTLWLNVGDTYLYKDLCCIPERIMLAMKDDGWILRNKDIWHKNNHIPSSVKDRLTSSWEPLYFFVKRKQYYFKLNAIRVPHKYPESLGDRPENGKTGKKRTGAPQGSRKGHPLGKNPGDFLEINTKPYKEAHFATFPPALPEFCIKASCPPHGMVLDPFAGSGTTMMVAKQMGRSSIGIEINPDYVPLIKKRLGNDPAVVHQIVPSPSPRLNVWAPLAPLPVVSVRKGRGMK